MRHSAAILLALVLLLPHRRTQRPSLSGCYVLVWPDSITRDSLWRKTFVDSLKLFPPFDASSPTTSLPMSLIDTLGAESKRWAKLTWASWQPLAPDRSISRSAPTTRSGISIFDLAGLWWRVRGPTRWGTTFRVPFQSTVPRCRAPEFGGRLTSG